MASGKSWANMVSASSVGSKERGSRPVHLHYTQSATRTGFHFHSPTILDESALPPSRVETTASSSELGNDDKGDECKERKEVNKMMGTEKMSAEDYAALCRSIDFTELLSSASSEYSVR